jgi:hypothetical protein
MLPSIFRSIFIAFSLSRLLLSNGLQVSNRSRLKRDVPVSATCQLRAEKSASVDDPPEKQAQSTHRAAAVFALMESSNSKSFFAIRKLENDRGYLSLDRRDRAFARLILTTAERRQGQIDKVINKFAPNPYNSKKVNHNAALRKTIAFI